MQLQQIVSCLLPIACLN